MDTRFLIGLVAALFIAWILIRIHRKPPRGLPDPASQCQRADDWRAHIPTPRF